MYKLAKTEYEKTTASYLIENLDSACKSVKYFDANQNEIEYTNDDYEVILNVDGKEYSIRKGLFISDRKISIIADAELKTWLKDNKPENGEYFSSRGVGYDDLSGFVSSKQAGERLLRYVKYILDTDTPKTRLDYREYEPCWIQFKFHASEFDLQKIHDATSETNIITEEIIKSAIKN